jgi:hypothetical protein
LADKRSSPSQQRGFKKPVQAAVMYMYPSAALEIMAAAGAAAAVLRQPS